MEQTTVKPWQAYIDKCADLSDSFSYDWVQRPLSYQAVDNNLLFQEGHSGGAGKITLKAFLKRLEALHVFKIAEKDYRSDDRGTSHDIFVWDDACCQLYYDYGDMEGQFYWTSNNRKLAREFKKLQALWKVKKPEGRVFVLVPSSSGLTTRSLGLGAVPLISDNYRPEVVKGYESVVKDISSPNPLGRLAIFDGPPGTGKTYLIRALLSALPNTKFLLLPSNMADNLSGPELLQVLIAEFDSFKAQPPTSSTSFPRTKSISSDSAPLTPQKTIVLVIEDADRCLATRASDNVSAISAILNLSDGIIGNLLDLRIICTTNVEGQSIDEAVMRTGRLSARIEVNMLDKEQAKAIYKRLGGTAEQSWAKKFYPLSDVYAMAKGLDLEEGEASSSPRKTKVGFAA